LDECRNWHSHELFRRHFEPSIFYIGRHSDNDSGLVIRPFERGGQYDLWQQYRLVRFAGIF
jgi:hypothetical protein